MDSAAEHGIEVTPPHGKENEPETPPAKRSRLSLSLGKRGRGTRGPPLKERFVSPSKTTSVYERAAEGVIPPNTRASTNTTDCYARATSSTMMI